MNNEILTIQRERNALSMSVKDKLAPMESPMVVMPNVFVVLTTSFHAENAANRDNGIANTRQMDQLSAVFLYMTNDNHTVIGAINGLPLQLRRPTKLTRRSVLNLYMEIPKQI